MYKDTYVAVKHYKHILSAEVENLKDELSQTARSVDD
jgi:hypothetical protein